MPADRLDRMLLLDTIIVKQLHQFGVDRLHIVSEKRVADGRVTMEVIFDLRHPEADRFSVTYLDGAGLVLRQERYPREEVESRFNFLHGRDVDCDQLESLDDAERQRHLDAQRAKREARMKEIEAATQPASQQ